MPEALKAAIDAISNNRSEYITEKLSAIMESEGLYSISNKARLIAAIQSVEPDISEDKVNEVIELLGRFQREEIAKGSK